MIGEMLKLTLAAIWLVIIVPFLVLLFYASCLIWALIGIALLALL